LVLGPIIALENEKRAMGIKKDTGLVTKKEKICQLGVRLGQTGVASREPQWELPEKKIGQYSLKRQNSDGMNLPSITDQDFTTDPQLKGPDNLGTTDRMMPPTKLGANMSGLAKIDAPKLTLEKMSSLRRNSERKFIKHTIPIAARLEDAGPDSDLEQRVLELEERLNQETALREALEKTVQILHAQVRTLGQKKSGEKAEFGVGSQAQDQFQWPESEFQDWKQGSEPNYNPTPQLEDARDQDYNRKFYLD
jgi:hypothetical protein